MGALQISGGICFLERKRTKWKQGGDGLRTGNREKRKEKRCCGGGHIIRVGRNPLSTLDEEVVRRKLQCCEDE